MVGGPSFDEGRAGRDPPQASGTRAQRDTEKGHPRKVGWLTLEACTHVHSLTLGSRLSGLSPALAQPPSPSCFTLRLPPRTPAPLSSAASRTSPPHATFISSLSPVDYCRRPSYHGNPLHESPLVISRHRRGAGQLGTSLLKGQNPQSSGLGWRGWKRTRRFAPARRPVSSRPAARRVQRRNGEGRCPARRATCLPASACTGVCVCVCVCVCVLDGEGGPRHSALRGTCRRSLCGWGLPMTGGV